MIVLSKLQKAKGNKYISKISLYQPKFTFNQSKITFKIIKTYSRS